MRRRTRAREVAVQFLYQLDLRGQEVLDDMEGFLKQESADTEVLEFAQRLISGTLEFRPELDERLQAVARNWDLKRMAAVDRNILRMAMFELLHCDDIPGKVTINEAIELGKKYSTANSGAFINGILDRVKNEAAPDKDRPAGARPSAARPAGAARAEPARPAAEQVAAERKV